jgi:acyl-CoA synthetase (NDP forming)
VITTLASLPYIDGVVVTSPASARIMPGKKDEEIPEVVQESLRAIMEVPKAGKPVVALSPLGGVFGGSKAPQVLKEAGIPLYQTPSQCARGMAALVRYAQFRS